MLPPSPAFDWSGVYLGVHAGYGGGMKDWTGEGMHFPVRGFLGGAQIGINKQIASFVVGLEMEGSWANIAGSQAVTNGSMGPFFLGLSALSASSRIEAMATFAGRAGLAADRWFVFAKGGLAGAWEKHSLDYTNDFAFGGSVAESVRGSEFRIAPMIGFGAEYALDPHWSIKAEYDYLHFGSRTVALNGTATFNGTIDPAFRADEPVKQDAIHLVKIGANYRLGPVATDPAYRPVRAAQGTDWTGAFLGVQGGYGFGRMDRSTFIDPASSAAAAHDLTGWLGGFAGGVNVQSGVFVFGVEGEWMWTGLRGGRSFTAPDHTFGGTVVNNLNSSIDWLAIASAKAGFVVGDRLLVYGKGGLAIASERHSAAGTETFPAPNPDVFTSATSGRAVHSGVAVGAGAEYALGGNWSIKGEYNYIRMIAQQHTDTGFVTITSVPPDQGNIAPGFDKVGQDLHLLKLGVNYHFNPLPGAVTARY
jgi:opacity protein-like surface antigen